MKQKLGDFCELINGDRGKNYPSQEDIKPEGDVPFVNAGHLNGKTVDFTDMNFISKEKYDSLSSGKFQKNDILYCLRGSLGKKAIIEENVMGAVASSLVIIRPNTEVVDVEYLLFALDSPNIKSQLSKANNGSSQPNLSAASVRQYEVDIPDLTTQRAVAKRLEKVNSLINNRLEELRYLDDLIKARFVEMFGGIDTYCEVGHYIDSLTAGKSLAGEAECENKVLKTGAASFDYFDASQVKNLPLDYEPQPEHRVQNGDVIISRMNTAELTGAAAYVWNVPENTYLPDRLWKAHMKKGVNPIFVWQTLIQPETKEQIRRDASGTSGSMKNISKPGLLAIKVKKVPAKEQDVFAAFVQQVDKSKVDIQKALDETQILFDSLMQEYFG